MTPISRLSWAQTTSWTTHSIYTDLHCLYSRHSSDKPTTLLIVNLFRPRLKLPSAHDQSCPQDRSPSITTLTMPPEPRRERNEYLKTAAYQIAHTPRATPKEFPGSFEEKPLYGERQCKNVPPPATSRPNDEQFFLYDRSGAPMPNLDFIRKHFLDEGRLTEQQAIYILERTTDLLSREPNLLSVPSPVTGELPRAIGVCNSLTRSSSLRRHSWAVCRYRPPTVAQSIY